jgi:hypothetical protein
MIPPRNRRSRPGQEAASLENSGNNNDDAGTSNQSARRPQEEAGRCAPSMPRPR